MPYVPPKYAALGHGIGPVGTPKPKLANVGRVEPAGDVLEPKLASSTPKQDKPQVANDEPAKKKPRRRRAKDAIMPTLSIEDSNVNPYTVFRQLNR